MFDLIMSMAPILPELYLTNSFFFFFFFNFFCFLCSYSLLDLVRPFLDLVRPHVVFVILHPSSITDNLSRFIDRRSTLYHSSFPSNSSSLFLSIPPELLQYIYLIDLGCKLQCRRPFSFRI
ncbi:hypothetical protein AQUCO_07300023v1 [Aquilegia coerulea]|uniref:Uncharacterized protein n=1 Tax=Aquilegia coerulea TaxID=218851 RepID=A0A2G5C9V1_AQUCA|nr:hypothetical protein AQUCO_07300023v1 [Aquilegia coerulea]